MVKLSLFASGCLEINQTKDTTTEDRVVNVFIGIVEVLAISIGRTSSISTIDIGGETFEDRQCTKIVTLDVEGWLAELAELGNLLQKFVELAINCDELVVIIMIFVKTG